MDSYTKTVLTVIAAALCIIAANGLREGLVGEAHAATDLSDVRVVAFPDDIVLRVDVQNASEVGKQIAAWQRKRGLTP